MQSANAAQCVSTNVYIWIGMIGVMQQGEMDAVLHVAIAWLCT